VLKGEMSVVGARPIVDRELSEYYKEHGGLYCSLKPGITGMWQVSMRSETENHRDVAGEHEERDGKLSGSRGAGYVVCIEPFHVDGSQDYFQDGMGGVQREGGVIERAVKGKLVNSERLRVKRGKEGF